MKAADSSRPVQYERAGYDGKTDIFCPMYHSYENCIKYSENAKWQKPLIQCEYAHAMGNSQGGFREYWELIRRYPKYQGGFIWDFVDQSPRWKGKNGATIYGYGGDFNRFDASDINFCDNGLISPDRVPNPHMYEVGYYYQNIWTTLAGTNPEQGEATVKVFNENFFRNLDAYALQWELLKNGRVMRSGRVENLAVEAQQTQTLALPVGKTCACAEWLLNVSYVQKNTEGLLPAGHIVAKNQLVLNAYKPQPLQLNDVVETNVEIETPTVADNQTNYLIVEGNGFTVEFDKENGWMTKYSVDGLDMIKEGEALTPNFWRAPTDNDFGAELQNKYRVWHQPEIKLNALKHRIEGHQVIVEATYTLPAVKADLAMTYVINNAGAVKVTQAMKAGKNQKVANLFRFGVQMPMPRSFETVEYYGRGPVENYSDRKDCAFLGVYRQTVDEQFYPYIRPQENGAKGDLRWWKIMGAHGRGLQVVAEAPFSASALHYTIESLDEGTRKRQGHSQEVEPADLTNLCLDLVQMGLGCENSWGAIARPEYHVPYADYTFTFMFTPIKNGVRMAQ